MSEFGNNLLGKSVRGLDISDKFAGYSGVDVIVSDNVTHSVGDDTGRVLTIQNEWGTRQQAQRVLNAIKGFRYQPYSATGAFLSPAAEVGDAVTVNDVYSGIYKLTKNFTLMEAEIEAPEDEEIDHEFPFEPKQDRVYKRELAETKASIAITAESITSEVERRDASIRADLGEDISESAEALTRDYVSRIEQTATQIKSTVAESTSKYDTLDTSIDYYGFGGAYVNGYPAADNNGKVYLDQETGKCYQSNGEKWNKIATFNLITENLSSAITQNADEISAKVSKRGGDSSSFEWRLTDEQWALLSNGSTVFKVNADGAEVKGKLTATSGFIGNGSSGFTITATAIYNKKTNIEDTEKNGIYIGTDGIALGKGKFKVTSAGEVTASNLTITGGSITLGEDGQFKVDKNGNLTAHNAKLTGTLNIGGTNISADALRSGAQSAYSSGGYWSGGAGYGYNYNNATKESGGVYPSFFKASVLSCSTIVISNRTFTVYSLSAEWKTKAFYDRDGNYVVIQYLGH